MCKKAVQLGIEEIYYIDPYPGISEKHIIKFGSNCTPTLQLFYGAIGSAYMRLYISRIPLKDELKLITGIENKQIIDEVKNGHLNNLGVTDIKYMNYETTLIFKSRTDIIQTTEHEMQALHDNIDKISSNIYWTGSSFNGMKILNCNREYSFENLPRMKLPYVSVLTFKNALNKNESVKFTIQSEAKDSQRIMSPYFARLVFVKTDNLKLNIQAPEGLLKKVRTVIYADLNMNKDYIVSSNKLESHLKDEIEYFSFEIPNPNLMYSYCIEWVFDDEF